MEVHELPNDKKEKIKKWLKDPYLVLLIILLAFSFFVRLYFFISTASQPLWWDEAAYGILAKNHISQDWSQTSIIQGETSIRPPLFPWLWAILLIFGFGEIVARFILEFIPSFLSVFLVYLIGAELYNKKIGLIAGFIFSVFWINLFYTSRLLTHVPEIFFLLLSVFYFIKSIKEEFIPKYFSIAIIFALISTFIRYPEGIIFGAYFVFLLIVRFSLFKTKKFWLSGILGFSPLLLFFAYNLITKGNIFPALFGSDYVQPISEKFAFHLLNFVPLYLKSVFFIAFLLGSLILLFDLIIGYDSIKSNKKLSAHILMLLILLVFYGYFIFSLKGAEDRWLFSTMLPLSLIASLGIIWVSEKTKKYGKGISIILIIAILISGIYIQLNFANSLIKAKSPSFLQEKQGFEWLKMNTPKDAIILGAGIEVYSLYYGNRLYETFPQNSSDIIYSNASYMVAHIFAPHPAYINEYTSTSQNVWRPIQAYFIDEAKTQPAFVIYQRIQ